MSLFTPPNVRATDANNAALSGAKWYFYTTGTTTPADVYTTSARSVAHSNPVVADAGGKFASIYLDPAVTYRAVLKTSADVTLYDIDPLPTAIQTSDLAASTGSSLVGHIGASDDAVARTLQAKARDIVSVLDFIPVAEHAAIRAQTSTTDVSSYIQNADDYLYSLGGGTLHFPLGYYRLDAQITKNKWVSWKGEGVGTSLRWGSSFVGIGIRQNLGLGAGGSNPIVFEGMRLVHLGGIAAAGTRIGLYDTGSHGTQFRDFGTSGWKYGVVLDQSEEIDFYGFDSNDATSLWIANGEETELGNTGAAGGFTNRITIHSGKFNGITNYGILDDGGEVHVFSNINCNAGTFLRAAGVSTLTVGPGNYIEGGSGNAIELAATALSDGRSVGACSAIKVFGSQAAPPVGGTLINAASAGRLIVETNNVTGTTPELITGAINCAGIWTRANNTSRDILDGKPVFYQEIGEEMLWVSTTYDPPSLAAGAKTAIQTYTHTGIDLTWSVETALFSNNLAGCRIQAWVSATDTISYYFINENGADPTDLASGTISFLLRKKY